VELFFGFSVSEKPKKAGTEGGKAAQKKS